METMPPPPPPSWTWIQVLNWASAVVLLLAVVCRLSRAARFHLKSSLLYVFIFANAVLSVPYGLLRPSQFRRNTLFSARLSRLWDPLLGVRWRVRVDEDSGVDKSRGFIIVCNHQSSLDTYGMMRVWHHFGPVRTIVKRSLLWTGPFGLNLYLNGAIFLDRTSPKGRETLNKAVKQAKESGASIWIFPEGTRKTKRDLTLLPFKKGAFHMALDAGMDILPVVISQYDFLDPATLTFDGGEATIRVLRPIPTAGYTKETMGELIEKTRDTMTEALREVSRPPLVEEEEGKKDK